MPDSAVHENTEQPVQSILQSSGSTAFYLWLLITFSAGIVMAQDTWYSAHNPRYGTVDETATFTKVLVIHSLWLLISLAFVVFTWLYRPTAAWKLHLLVGGIACIWTLGVLVNAFTEVKTLEVTTWQCSTAPTSDVADEEFLENCELARPNTTIRMGSSIYFWSVDDKHWWRWIVPGNDRETLQMNWPLQVSAIYIATEDDPQLSAGAMESLPGGTWRAVFDPGQDRSFRIYFIESSPAIDKN